MPGSYAGVPGATGGIGLAGGVAGAAGGILLGSKGGVPGGIGLSLGTSDGGVTGGSVPRGTPRRKKFELARFVANRLVKPGETVLGNLFVARRLVMAGSISPGTPGTDGACPFDSPARQVAATNTRVSGSLFIDSPERAPPPPPPRRAGRMGPPTQPRFSCVLPCFAVC
jgi:hypothetical protein